MPYILQKDRPRVLEVGPETEGELNYFITYHINEFLKRRGLSYVVMNDVMGALTGAQEEFYRKVVAPYEDKKIALNGEVYDEKFL